MEVAQVFSFFSELAFPIAVAAFLLISTAKQLEQMRIAMLKTQLLIALLLMHHDIDVPDAQLDGLVGVLAKEKKK